MLIHRTMPSVENFYWILFENLLKPVGLDCWYYYPFGTQNNLSKFQEFKPYQVKQTHHVLFHFDQEPIWEDNLGKLYDTDQMHWDLKKLRILANSEKSVLKKKICSDRGMIEWYYFYHGFASLDWFRDGAYCSESSPITKVYCSLNHLTVKKRAYRMALTARLSQRQLITQGDISFHNDASGCLQEANDVNSLLSDAEKTLVKEQLGNHQQLPMCLDHANVNGDFSARFGHQEYKLWQRSFLSVVNETVFYDKKLHLTEKIFKPIVCCRPFVLVAAPGNLAYLRGYGFQTFSPWIDESYDDESDDSKRLDMIVDEIAKLCARPFGEILRMHDEMRPVLEYNKKHFFTTFRQIIVNELVENFDSAVRIWNNGRVDGRDLPLVTDTDRIKRLLVS